MRHYCTYFDINFLARGLVLVDSLKQHENDFVLYALCLDDISYGVINRLNDPHCLPIALSDLEAFDARLPVARANRTRIEYYFTLSPFLPLYLLTTFPNIPYITYVDADCFFYASPQPIYDELGDGSVLVIEHRFARSDAGRLKYGRFNVGLQVFRRDRYALDCLRNWAGQCAEWCYDKVEDGKFADQKYLDEWPIICRGLKILQHKGVNVAPWNIGNVMLACRNSRLYVDDVPLIMYHFHDLRFVTSEMYCPTNDDRYLCALHLKLLYTDYVQAVKTKAVHNAIDVCGHIRTKSSANSYNTDNLFSGGQCLSIALSPEGTSLWKWRIAHYRRNCNRTLEQIIMAFQAEEWSLLRHCLLTGVVQYPQLLMNHHIWNIILRRFFIDRKKHLTS